MPSYLVYGLTISSNQLIPGLVADSEDYSQPDMRIWLGEIPSWLDQLSPAKCTQQEWYISNYRDENGEPGLSISKLNQNGFFWIRYSDQTQFVVDANGTQIWGIWPDDLTLEDTATYLLGPILGWVLRLRGVTCLHASAVVVDGQVLAFVGDAGAGKSTTAAAFAQAGYGVLSDDVVALVDGGHHFLVQPAYPRIRLWSDSAIALYGKVDMLPRIVPTSQTWDKRYLDLNQDGYQFPCQTLPLTAIYLLNERSNHNDAPYIETISESTGLVSLVGNTYGNYLLDKDMRQQEFELLGRLIKTVKMRQVTPHRDVARLPQLVETVLADFTALLVK